MVYIYFIFSLSGGHKVWECSLDLCSYVASNVACCGRRVAEVGCGAGLPGILSGLQGASEIMFQDFVSSSDYFSWFFIYYVVSLTSLG